MLQGVETSSLMINLGTAVSGQDVSSRPHSIRPGRAGIGSGWRLIPDVLISPKKSHSVNFSWINAMDWMRFWLFRGTFPLRSW